MNIYIYIYIYICWDSIFITHLFFNQHPPHKLWPLIGSSGESELNIQRLSWPRTTITLHYHFDHLSSLLTHNKHPSPPRQLAYSSWKRQDLQLMFMHSRRAMLLLLNTNVGREMEKRWCKIFIFVFFLSYPMVIPPDARLRQRMSSSRHNGCLFEASISQKESRY